jgi:DEAD/DEAH box helicase domain-containing protein
MKMRKISDLHGRNIVIFDLEIKATIDGKSVKWTDYDKMGISVGCLFDYRTGDNHVYMDENMGDLVDRLQDAELISGFNIIGFDIPLLTATTHRPVMLGKIYDILKEVRRSTGVPFPKGCSLNEVLNSTFGIEKTENGSDAPLFYQRGEISKLITYCLADVRRERMAFEHAYLHGSLSTATHGIHEMRNALD